MVNLSGKRSNQLTSVKKSLEDNLLINPASSRLSDIDDAIIDSKYRIKDLSETTFNAITQCRGLNVLDGKIFCFTGSGQAGIIEVYDILSMSLIKTLNVNSSSINTAFAYDDTSIYLVRLYRVNDKPRVTILKYNRCTLNLAEESPIIYSSETVGSTVTANGLCYKNGFLYLTVAFTGDHHVKKIDVVDYSSTRADYNTPLNVVATNGNILVSGGGEPLLANPGYRKIGVFDLDLTFIDWLPQNSITTSLYRGMLVDGDFVYAGNDSGVIVKYKISTKELVNEIQIDSGIVRGISKTKNGLLVQSNTSKIYFLSNSLEIVKVWDYYNATTLVGFGICDNNQTIYTHSYQYPKIYKKQFIDQTEDVI